MSSKFIFILYLSWKHNFILWQYCLTLLVINTSNYAYMPGTAWKLGIYWFYGMRHPAYQNICFLGQGFHFWDQNTFCRIYHKKSAWNGLKRPIQAVKRQCDSENRFLSQKLFQEPQKYIVWNKKCYHIDIFSFRPMRPIGLKK